MQIRKESHTFLLEKGKYLITEPYDFIEAIEKYLSNERGYEFDKDDLENKEQELLGHDGYVDAGGYCKTKYSMSVYAPSVDIFIRGLDKIYYSRNGVICLFKIDYLPKDYFRVWEKIKDTEESRTKSIIYKEIYNSLRGHGINNENIHRFINSITTHIVLDLNSNSVCTFDYEHKGTLSFIKADLHIFNKQFESSELILKASELSEIGTDYKMLCKSVGIQP